MKFRSFIYFTASLVALASCQKEAPVYTVGEADNAIQLSAGIVDGGSSLQTKALDANHAKHVALAKGIKLRLKVDGTWAGKTNPAISQTTVATIGDETASGSMHNSLTIDPVIYWDDYGTADPANATTGRAAGLSILGVAVNDATQENALAVPTDWASYAWAVDADQTSGWSKKDLIASYNLQSGKDGCYTFDAQKAGTANAGLLEFRHVMSKVTVVLTAGKGFADSKFVAEPTAQLHGFYQSGNVNLTDGALSDQAGNGSAGSPTNIATYCENATKTGQTTVTRTALVFPGRTLAGTEHIATVTADGNIYKITAAKLFAAMTDANSHTDKTLKSGYNYILNITVDKTEVKVSATVVDWIDVIAEVDAPKIEVSTSYGEDGGNFGKGFSFYYSTNKTYLGSDKDYYGSLVSSTYYQADRTVSFTSGTNTYALDTPLYWPDHSTKYFFRGVWPETNTTGATTSPYVVVFNNGTRDCEGIPVTDATYSAGSAPSDLMLGIPERTTTGGTNESEPADGIGATEGTISLTFKYRMCQVEVRLLSSGKDLADNIDFGSTGGAEQATVKIVNSYKEGYVLLSDGSISYKTGVTPADYTMTPKSTTLPSAIPTATEYSALGDWSSYQYLVRHDAIIPQDLTNTTGDVKFEIQTGKTGDYDKYAIAIKDIKVSENGGAAKLITAWEAGKHYIYTLKITKTQIKIEATITDWVPVVAGGDFWL